MIFLCGNNSKVVVFWGCLALSRNERKPPPALAGSECVTRLQDAWSMIEIRGFQKRQQDVFMETPVNYTSAALKDRQRNE